MSRNKLLESLEEGQLKQSIPQFRVGDTIRVSTKIIEGEKERIQVFQGTVIARKGSGLSETFSMHRVSYGEGMERVFSLHSPRIVKIEVVKHGDVRRSKLYHLRGTTGKAAKVKEKIGRRSSAVKGAKKPTPSEKSEATVVEPVVSESLDVKEESDPKPAETPAT